MLGLKYQCTLSLGRGKFANHLRQNWDDLEIFEIGQSPLRIIRARHGLSPWGTRLAATTTTIAATWRLNRSRDRSMHAVRICITQASSDDEVEKVVFIV